MISKETFVAAIRDLQRAWDYQEGLNAYFKSSGVDGYVFQPDCSNMVIKLLDEAMNLAVDEQVGSDVSYFCYELDFGRKFKLGDVKVDGVDVDFSTPEALYDYLTKNWNEEES